MRTKLILAGLLLFLLVAGFFWYSAGSGIKLTDKDTLLIGDFANSTGDSAFDGSLREAVSIGLAQSPLLNLISAEKVAEALRSQSLPPNSPLTRELAPKLCANLGATVFLTGSVNKDDNNHYALNLNTFQCVSSKEIASVKGEAKGKAEVVHALGEAAFRLRGALGDGADSLKQFNLPLERATSASLEAIKSFYERRSLSREQGSLMVSLPSKKPLRSIRGSPWPDPTSPSVITT